MLTVVVARPPLFGAKLGTFDANEALKVPGVIDVKAIPSGVAVYATSTWPALKGRDALSVSWDESGAEKRGSAEPINDYRALAQTPGRVAGLRGNAEPLHGITFALLHLSCMRIIVQVVPHSLSGTAQAIDGAVGVGGAVALMTLVSGMLYGRFGAHGFWAMAALCVLALPLAVSLRHRPQVISSEASPSIPHPRSANRK